MDLMKANKKFYSTIGIFTIGGLFLWSINDPKVMSYFDNKNRFENILKKVESEYSKKYGKGTNYNNEFVQNLIKSLNSKFDKI